jgi:metallo-beta-lactamase family protein
MEVKFKLQFLGAAKMVTGSSYLLDIFEDGNQVARLMIDHGMFMGSDDDNGGNRAAYTFDPATIDFLVLTHAHIDHSGLLPKLVNKGFSGKILATKQTISLSELMLYDSAKIQGYAENEDNIARIYHEDDVFATMKLFTELEPDREYNLDIDSGEGIKIKLYRAGHILGAASARIEYKGKSITFSGDLGRSTQGIIRPFSKEEKESDYVVTESLYGGKFHEDINETIQHLVDRSAKTLQSNGNVIVPAFSIQRAQEMLVILNNAIKNGGLQKDVQVFFDSPLAQKVTKVYTENDVELDPEFTKFGTLAQQIYSANVKEIWNSNKTKKIKKKKGVVILTGGGMINGGKVLSYLKTMINNPENLLTIIGFQAEDTLGRELIEGAKQITIDGEEYPVRIKIEVFRGFSAHADQHDLLEWLGTFNKERVQKVFLVHAEIEQSLAYESELKAKGYEVVIPGLGEAHDL